jgi:hypothetical protein
VGGDLTLPSKWGCDTQSKPKSEISFTVVTKLDIGSDNLALDFLHIPNNIHVDIVLARIKI